MRKRAWALLLLLAAGAAGETIVVKREKARVMKAPRFFGEACAVQVAPGQRLRVAERRGSWARLAAPGDGLCWLHETAWVDRAPGELVGDPARASQRDYELAGRGFSEEEVASYRKENPGLDAEFKLVDAYVARSGETPPSELSAFVAAGKLGGAP